MTVQGPDGPALYPWAALWKVNGKPAQERLLRLKRSSAVFCPDCRGGLVARVCPECLGTSTVYGRSTRCEPCGGKGTGLEPCLDCDKGRQPCPGRCLRREAGVWRDVPGVGRARAFFFRSGKGGAGTTYLTERQLGLVYEFKEVPPFPLPECAMCGSGREPCARCRAAGTFVETSPVLKGECPECGGPARGAGQRVCGTCLGSGKSTCGRCFGAGSTPVPESAASCGGCAKGTVACVPCADTGLLASPPKTAPTDVRKALARVEGPLPATHRVTFRDGRIVDGAVLQNLQDGFLFLAGSESDLRLWEVPARQGARREELAATPRTDTVVLKDGKTVHGRIVAQSDQLLMLRTSEGETLKIEVARIAEIRPKK
jgi:hypothetical protein